MQNLKFDRSISTDIKAAACRTTTNFHNVRDKNQFERNHQMSLGREVDAERLMKQQAGRSMY